jgi:pantoate--beta-alanine ligase
MRTIRTIAELRAHLARARAEGRSVGLVPTMGAFHAGHHSLIRAARNDHGEVVVSLFVNPAQFNDAGDLAAYPRTEAQDAAEAAELGVDVLFAPPVEEIYPPGFSTRVQVDGLSEILEGAERGPGHFAGVCTVVTKLLNIVGPDVAYFGQKDAQQVAVVARMIRDLDIPVRLEAMPTVREPDGLALSSRNRRLDPADRARALALSNALDAAARAVAAGERDAGRVRELAVAELAGVDAEYLAIVDPDSFQELTTIDGRALVAVAAHVGPVRLIDNVVLHVSSGGDPLGRQPRKEPKCPPHPVTSASA